MTITTIENPDPTGELVNIWREIIPTVAVAASNINDIAIDNAGLAVIVGADGKIATSSDLGVTWTLGTSGFGTSDIYDVNYGGSGWLAGGADGKVFASVDALTWAAETVGFGTAAVNSVLDDTDGFGVSLAGGAAGHLEVSSLGVWTPYTSSFGTSDINKLTPFQYQELLLAAGDDGKIARTGDGGSTWTQSTTAFGTDNVNDIVAFPGYSSSLSVAVGDNGSIEYSANGSTYIAASVNPFAATENVNGIATNGAKFCAVGDAGSMAVSADGDIWAEIADSSFGTTNINSIAYDSLNDIWIAVGDDGKVATSSGFLTTWTQQVSGF